MKSGLLEIADILVVNKGDRPGAEETMHQLMGALSIRASARSKSPVLKTTATTGEGVPNLVSVIDRIGQDIAAEAPIERRRRRARYLIARAASDIVALRIKEGASGKLEALSDDVLAGRIRPEDAAIELVGR
jgi:LAO/AO transport system kinase